MAITSYPQLITDICILSLSSLVFIFVIFLLLQRREYQPLRSKGAKLIIISTVGNFLYTALILIVKIYNNVHELGFVYAKSEEDLRNPSCVLGLVESGFAFPLFIIPYFLRAFRLFQVFTAHHRQYLEKKRNGIRSIFKKKQLYCVKEVTLTKWILLIMMPILVILTSLAVAVPEFQLGMPVLGVSICYDNPAHYQWHFNYSLAMYIGISFMLNTLFLMAIYALRHVQDEFSISIEFKCTFAIWSISSFVMYFMLIYEEERTFVRNSAIDYFEITRNLLCLLVTAIIPVYQSFKPDTIIPFPINEECIKTLEMALLLPTSANFFYEYLEKHCPDKDALIYFALYADIRQYFRMIEEDQPDKVVRRCADQIFHDYILEERNWQLEIKDTILDDLREIYQVTGNLNTYQFDDSLFLDLYAYNLDILDAYYQQFQAGPIFDELKNEVSRQEILYDILRRYQMINN